MSARQSVFIYLAVEIVLGALSGTLAPAHRDVGAVIGMVWFLLVPMMGYVWFRLDSVERGFHRSPAWGPSIIMFTVLALPIYLYKSRAKGRRLKSLALFFGVVLLSIALPALTAAFFER